MPPPTNRNVNMPVYLNWHRPDGAVVPGWLVTVMNQRTTMNGQFIGVFVESGTGHIHEAPINELIVTAGQMGQWDTP